MAAEEKTMTSLYIFSVSDVIWTSEDIFYQKKCDLTTGAKHFLSVAEFYCHFGQNILKELVTLAGGKIFSYRPNLTGSTDICFNQRAITRNAIHSELGTKLMKGVRGQLPTNVISIVRIQHF